MTSDDLDPLRRIQAPQRRKKILDALRSSGFRSVAELVDEFGVSDMTIRRDLRELEKTGEIRTVHGGAGLAPQSGVTRGFTERTIRNAEPKRLVAAAALTLVGKCDTIALDAGTTAHAIAEGLPDTFTGSVVTHSAPVVQTMLDKPAAALVCLGGDLHPASRSFAGPLTETNAANLRVRTYFLGAASVDPRGVYVRAGVEAAVKRALMSIADTVVLVADNDKFATSAPVLVCPLDKIDVLVTDRPLHTAMARALQAGGVEVVVADPPASDRSGAAPTKKNVRASTA